MATNWGYIPLIGSPVALRNDAGEDIPRIFLPQFLGPPRKGVLKTYFTILNFASTAAPDDKIKITTRIPNNPKQEQIDTNLNALIPILTWVKGVFGPTQEWQVLSSVVLPGTDLLEATIGLFNAPLAPVQLILCIDYSHTIVD